MILVRLVFQAKFGKAAELVASFKSGEEMMGAGRGRNVKILTDLSGPFDTVVQEVEYDSLEVFMEDQARMFADPKFGAAMEGSRDLIRNGYKEYYTIE